VLVGVCDSDHLSELKASRSIDRWLAFSPAKRRIVVVPAHRRTETKLQSMKSRDGLLSQSTRRL